MNDVEARRQAARHLITGVLLLAGAGALALLTGWLTSEASEAANGSAGGVRIISVPLLLLGVLQVGRGLLDYGRISRQEGSGK